MAPQNADVSGIGKLSMQIHKTIIFEFNCVYHDRLSLTKVEMVIELQCSF